MTLKDLDSLPTTKQEKTFSSTYQTLMVELREGDSVEYTEEEGRKGMVAANVQVV